jgi:hypothetical protein
MAFHQPTRQAMQKALRPAADERETTGAHPLAQQQVAQPEQSQTWVLFSPASESQTASEFSETQQSGQTAGRSRPSDLGTNVEGRSDQLGDDGFSVEPSVIGHDALEDDAELDSLDSHLPSFRSVPGIDMRHDEHHYSAPVLPAHDGLGSFHLDNPAISADAQNQIYQFEKFNPRRLHSRQDSLEHTQIEFDQEHPGEAEKRHRIEAWRLEHSRVLLEEVQKETRRRRRSQASLRQVQNLASSTAPDARASADAEDDDLAWHDEDATALEDDSGNDFTAFTQRIIKDLLGIDDRLLSILLGGSIVDDQQELSSTPRASQLNKSGLTATQDHVDWRDHLTEVISREIGLLVNQLSQHPGAFSTFSNLQQVPLPYAGLPIIPEVSTLPTHRSSVKSTKSESPAADFKPTVAGPTRPISIPGQPVDCHASEDTDMEGAFTKDEWEQDLDIKLVFRYIRSRFTSRPASTAQNNMNHPATSNTQDMAAKAARVRQHHPLISRARPTERRTFKATAPSSPSVALRHQSSCASQSTRRSARRSSCSSRHYWDIGGSLGTGSMIASNGPMGSWGEV